MALLLQATEHLLNKARPLLTILAPPTILMPNTNRPLLKALPSPWAVLKAATILTPTTNRLLPRITEDIPLKIPSPAMATVHPLATTTTISKAVMAAHLNISKEDATTDPLADPDSTSKERVALLALVTGSALPAATTTSHTAQPANSAPSPDPPQLPSWIEMKKVDLPDALNATRTPILMLLMTGPASNAGLETLASAPHAMTATRQNLKAHPLMALCATLEDTIALDPTKTVIEGTHQHIKQALARWQIRMDS